MKGDKPKAVTKELVLHLPCTKEAIVEARTKLDSFVRQNGFEREACDITLVAQEALKNIYQHAHPVDKKMHLRCVVKQDRVLLEIWDKGKGFNVEEVERRRRPIMSTHGRGFELMQGLTDSFEIKSGSEGTYLRMVLKRWESGKRSDGLEQCLP